MSRFKVPEFVVFDRFDDLSKSIAKAHLGIKEEGLNVFSLFQTIERFKKSESVTAPQYEYYLFFPEDEIHNKFETVIQAFFDESLWTFGYGFLAAQIIVSSVISILVYKLSVEFVRPIKDLTH